MTRNNNMTGMGELQKDYYVYIAKVQNLAPSVSLTSIISIEADATFTLVKTSYFADIANATQTESSRVVPVIDVSITDSGSGRNLQNSPVPIDSIAGRGELPFVIPVPRFFKANSSINVTFTNSSAAATYTNVSLAFIGYKTFYR